MKTMTIRVRQYFRATLKMLSSLNGHRLKTCFTVAAMTIQLNVGDMSKVLMTGYAVKRCKATHQQYGNLTLVHVAYI